MKIWILSDLHDDRGLVDVKRPEAFDLFVCAGDLLTGDVAGSIEMTAQLARGKPSVFVAGNHEWMMSTDVDQVLHDAHETSRREGVHFLECDSVEIGGVKFAGATMWAPHDTQFAPSVNALTRARADVVVTHFPPSFPMRTPFGGAKLWIYGHHHGFEEWRNGDLRFVRNAVGYGAGEELFDSEPARDAYVVEI